MNRFVVSLSLFCAISLATLQSASAVVTIAWSPVGNAGNGNDPATGDLFGGVGYNYNIGTKDVTNSQYAEFLNTKDPTSEANCHIAGAHCGSAVYH